MAEYVVGYTDNLDPTLVRERIVRCRDCRFCRRHKPVFFADKKTYEGDFLMCVAVCETEWPGHEFHVSPDGFCSWGKERDA